MRCDLFDLVQLSSGDAETLYETICGTFEKEFL